MIILNHESSSNKKFPYNSHKMAVVHLYVSENLSQQAKCQDGENHSHVIGTQTLRAAAKLCRFLYLMKYGLLAGCLMLSGDIKLNLGPIDLQTSSQGGGLTVGQCNIQHLTETKFQEISLSLNIHKNSTNKVDVVILTEM